MGHKTLRDFIRAIRSSKTPHNESIIIRKELSYIRLMSSKNKLSVDYKNLSKLLYIYMFGHISGYGQMECLKLISSKNYRYKRLGYAGVMVLFGENPDVKMLLVNSIKQDLMSDDIYVVGLALCTIGNIASKYMVKQLYSDVLKLLSGANLYVRKKAAVCATQILRQVPDLSWVYLDWTLDMLSRKDTECIMVVIILSIELCRINESMKDKYYRFIPRMSNMLKSMSDRIDCIQDGIGGLEASFVQVYILRFLRCLGKGSVEASMKMVDVLVYMSSRLKRTSLDEHLITYELIITIFAIEPDKLLYIAVVDLLSGVISSEDNNLRYIALSILTKVGKSHPFLLEQYRNTVMNCLYDPDISIRKRSLDIAFSVVSGDNIEHFFDEMIMYIGVADQDLIETITLKLMESIVRFTPSSKWLIDSTIQLFKFSKCQSDYLSTLFVKFVSNCGVDAQYYAINKMYDIIHEGNIDSNPMIQSVSWLFGDLSYILIKSRHGFEVVNVLKLLFDIIKSNRIVNTLSKYFIIAAVMKITSKFPQFLENTKSLFYSLIGEGDEQIKDIRPTFIFYTKMLKDVPVLLQAFATFPPPRLDVKNKDLIGIDTINSLAIKNHYIEERPTDLIFLDKKIIYKRYNVQILLTGMKDRKDKSAYTARLCIENNNEDVIINNLSVNAAFQKKTIGYIFPPQSETIQPFESVNQLVKMKCPCELATVKIKFKIEYDFGLVCTSDIISCEFSGVEGSTNLRLGYTTIV